MAGVVVKRMNPKQMAMGAIALVVVMMIPKVGDLISNAIGTVRTKIGGGV